MTKRIKRRDSMRTAPVAGLRARRQARTSHIAVHEARVLSARRKFGDGAVAHESRRLIRLVMSLSGKFK